MVLGKRDLAQTKTDMVLAEDVGTRCRVFFVLLARAGGCKRPKPSQKWVDAVPGSANRRRNLAIHQLDSDFRYSSSVNFTLTVHVNFYGQQWEHPHVGTPTPQTASSGIENVFGVEWLKRGDALGWPGARMTGKKGRCVVCVGKHHACAECKRKKTAAAAPSRGKHSFPRPFFKVVENDV